jgi:hypothetical protein
LMDGAAGHKQAFPAAKAEYIISRRLCSLCFVSHARPERIVKRSPNVICVLRALVLG